MERLEVMRQFVKLPKRVIRNQQRFSFRALYFFIDQNDRSCRLQSLVIIFRMVNKNDVSRFYHMDFVHAVNRKSFVANKFAGNQSGNFFERIDFWEFHKLVVGYRLLVVGQYPSTDNQQPSTVYSLTRSI